MKRFLVLSAVLSVAAIAAPIGTCVPGTLSSHVGNVCRGNVQRNALRPRNSVVKRQRGKVAGPGLRQQDDETKLGAPGDGIFDNFAYSGSLDASNVNIDSQMVGIPIYQIVGVNDQSNFSLAQGTSGQLLVANRPGPAYTLEPGTELGRPTFFAPTGSMVTASTWTGPGGTGDAILGLSSFELGHVEADTAVPEPASFALIVTGLFCLGLIRKRATPGPDDSRSRSDPEMQPAGN